MAALERGVEVLCNVFHFESILVAFRRHFGSILGASWLHFGGGFSGFEGVLEPSWTPLDSLGGNWEGRTHTKCGNWWILYFLCLGLIFTLLHFCRCTLRAH